jgi:hypothetical protein
MIRKDVFGIQLAVTYGDKNAKRVTTFSACSDIMAQRGGGIAIKFYLNRQQQREQWTASSN